MVMRTVNLSKEEVDTVRWLYTSGVYGAGVTFDQALAKWIKNHPRQVTPDSLFGSAWYSEYKSEHERALIERG